MPATLASLCQTLSFTQIGSKYHFYFCDDVLENSPPLILKPHTEQGRKEFIDAMASVNSLEEADSAIGVAIMMEDGLRLISTASEIDMTGDLGNFVQCHAGSKPELLALHGSYFIRANEDGSIAEAYRDDFAWAGMPRGRVAGTQGDSAFTLGLLQPGEGAVFILADKSDNEASILIEKAGNGNSFADKKAIFERLNEEAKTMSGTLRRIESGAFAMLSSEPLPNWREVLVKVADRHETDLPVLKRLRRIPLFIYKGSKVKPFRTKSEASPAAGSSDRFQALDVLSSGEKVFFWFCAQTNKGSSALLMDQDQNGLKQNSKALGAKGHFTRGVMRLSSKGYIEFNGKKAFPKFVEALADWVKTNMDANPQLRKFDGARFVQSDSTGIVDRQKNSSAWSFLQ